MKNLSRAAMVALLFALVGCGHQSPFLTRDGELADAWSAISDKKFVRTVGIGVAPDGIKDRTRRRGLARQSALVAARMELIALLRGVRIKGSIDISRLAEQKDLIRQLVDTTIAGAEEERIEFDASDACVAVLRIERSRVRRMLQATAGADAADADETMAALEKQVALVDARTKTLLTVMPGMKSEGR